MKKIRLFSMAILSIFAFSACDKKTVTTRNTTKTRHTTTKDSRSTTTKQKSTTDITPVINKTIYVSSSGTGRNDGTATDKPTTIKKALEIMNSGDTIYLIKGTYELDQKIQITMSGSEVKRNTLYAEKGTVIDFSSTKSDSISQNGGIVIDGSYWQVDNIEVQNSDDYGFTINGKSNRITNCSANYNAYGGFNVKSSLSSFTNCQAKGNNMTGYYSYGFYINGSGENNSFEACVAYNNLDSGFFILCNKPVTLNKCVAIDNGLDSDAGSSQRSGFIFNNKGHILTNCIAYNNAISGFLVPTLYPEKGSYSLINCEAINNHIRNYSLKANSTYTVNVSNCLSYNTYDEDDDGQVDAINDYIIGNVTNSIIFLDEAYYYEASDPNFNSMETDKETLDLSEFVNEYKINLEVPEQMKEYIDLDAKAAIDAEAEELEIEPDYSSLEYNIKFYKAGKIMLYDYLDRSVLFQDELFNKLEIDNYTYFGSDLSYPEE